MMPLFAGQPDATAGQGRPPVVSKGTMALIRVMRMTALLMPEAVHSSG
jgi:hypothetical protein